MAAQAVAIANVDIYLQRVSELYADVRGWMAALEPDAQFSETSIDLDEQATGPYKAETLEISRNGKPGIRLIPQGRYIINAEGYVEVESILGREMLVWIRAGGPGLGFRFLPGEGSAPEELYGEERYPGVKEGWAWVDVGHRTLKHLDCDVFRDGVLASIST
jgi:hypothetical protein